MQQMKAKKELIRGRSFVRIGQAFMASPNDRAHYLLHGEAEDVVTQDQRVATPRAPRAPQTATAKAPTE